VDATLILVWFAIAFLSGSLPFAVWVGQIFLQTDIRSFGDANPGASNVLRAGGRFSAALALLLDFLKGAMPVGIVHYGLGFAGWPLAVIAIAPVLGHAYSPFLGFRGGKAVATTCGIWAGLTIWEGPMVGGLLLGAAAYFVGTNGWAVLLAMVGTLAYFGLTPPSWNVFDARAAFVPTLLAVWIGNVILLAWKYRADLSQLPSLRR
jgi:glycerol-3-phosphate acyltransferase PlsY